MNAQQFNQQHEHARVLRITSAQINPTVGDVRGNIFLMLEAARTARNEDSQVIAFPELSLTGYYPGDMLDDDAFSQRIAEGLEQLRLVSRETPDLHWIIGMPLARQTGESGKRFHDGLVVLKNGKVITTYAKQLLPTYNVFDERRHFEPGPDVARVFSVNGVHVGVLICEDGWNNEGADYAVNPFTRLADAHPDVLVSINASPSKIGKREKRHTIFSQACKQHALPMLYVNQVGGHDQLVYDGASFAVDATGKVVFEDVRFATATTTLAFDAATKSFRASDGSDLTAVPAVGMAVMEFYLQQIVLGLRDYARRC